MILSYCTFATAQVLTNLARGTAQSGSATTLVDSNRTEADDYFSGGTVWILNGLNQHKSAKITDWDLTTKTFTFAAMANANAANTAYAAAPGDYPREVLIRSVLVALESLRVMVYNTDLALAEDVLEYDLPNGVYNLLRVETAQSDSAPYAWQVHRHWREVAGQLVFDAGTLPNLPGYLIRLAYAARASEEWETRYIELPDGSGYWQTGADDDLAWPTEIWEPQDDDLQIDNGIGIEAIKWAAAANALRWRAERTKSDDQALLQRLNEALTNAERMAGRWAPPTMSKDPRLASW